MNATIKKILLAAITLSATYSHAASNKTFLAPRPIGCNLAMESSLLEQYNTSNANNFGGNFEITGFYAKSTNKKDLGGYFSPTGNHSFTLNTNAGAATNGVATPPPSGSDINGGLVIYDEPRERTTNATISYNPVQEVYGTIFSYYQNLDKLLNGLYFAVKLPVLQIKNTMNASFDTSVFSSFFNGTLSTTPSNNDNGYLRYQLNNALIDNKNHNKITTADLAFKLGYTFLNQDTYKAALTLGLIIPTGNIPTGNYVFEPVGGNGGHLGLGLGYEFFWHIWENQHSHVQLHTSLDWRYLFEATETRTFGIISNRFPQGFGQYAPTTSYPVGFIIQDLKYAVTNSVANLSTVNAKVTPGNILDGTAGLTYSYKNLSLDIGYNLFYKESESVKHFAIVDGTNSLFLSCDQDLSAGSGKLDEETKVTALTNALLEDKTAASPHQLSNKVYSSISYIFKDITCPINVAFGGHYEFAANNATIQNWGVHIKTGIYF